MDEERKNPRPPFDKQVEPKQVPPNPSSPSGPTKKNTPPGRDASPEGETRIVDMPPVATTKSAIES
jgi:hypothetical protein